MLSLLVLCHWESGHWAGTPQRDGGQADFKTILQGTLLLCTGAVAGRLTGCLREGENRQEAGRKGQTLSTGTHRDEIELKAQLELKLQKDGQEEGITITPVAKGSSEKWGCINGGI